MVQTSTKTNSLCPKNFNLKIFYLPFIKIIKYLNKLKNKTHILPICFGNLKRSYSQCANRIKLLFSEKNQCFVIKINGYLVKLKIQAVRTKFQYKILTTIKNLINVILYAKFYSFNVLHIMPNSFEMY